MQKLTHIVLDCDPGHDDATAIMLAANNPRVVLDAVTTVAGNQTLPKTTLNACRVLQWIGRTGIPVYAGCSSPLVRDPVVAGDIHGETGLDGPVFPECRKLPEERHAVLFLIDHLRGSAEPVTVVTTGPMTNLAMALKLAPDISSRIERIVLMGGAVGNGNVTPAAEFNMLADPEAARICFSSGVPLVMVGLDVTRKVLCYPEIVERMRGIGSCASDLFAALMSHFCRTQKEIFGYDGGPLHDPVTVAYLTDPSVLTLKDCRIEVDTTGGPSYGRTNCDVFGYAKKKPNAKAALDIDASRFWDLIEDCFRRYL